MDSWETWKAERGTRFAHTLSKTQSSAICRMRSMVNEKVVNKLSTARPNYISNFCTSGHFRHHVITFCTTNISPSGTSANAPSACSWRVHYNAGPILARPDLLSSRKNTRDDILRGFYGLSFNIYSLIESTTMILNLYIPCSSLHFMRQSGLSPKCCFVRRAHGTSHLFSRITQTVCQIPRGQEHRQDTCQMNASVEYAPQCCHCRGQGCDHMRGLYGDDLWIRESAKSNLRVYYKRVTDVQYK